jgi:fucose 4-O-acetylase-like acetyltransferase
MVKRDKGIDLARGVAMIFIVAGHIAWLVLHSNNIFQYPVESFALDLMFIISAFLLARKESNGVISKQLFIKRTKFLLGSLIGFSVPFCIMMRINPLQFCKDEFMAYWFFLVLWLCMTVSEGVAYLSLLLKKRISSVKNRLHLELKLDILLWLFIWAIDFQLGPYIEYFPIEDLKLYYPCFIAGRMLAFYPQAMRYIFNKWSAAAALIIWIIAWIQYPNFLNIIYYVSGIAGSIFIWWLCTKLTKFRGLNFLATIGKETLWVYGLHFYPVMVAWYLTKDIDTGVLREAWAQLLIAPLSAVILSLLCIVVANLLRSRIAPLLHRRHK